jgi:RNA polymerase sigma-B factor
MRAHRRFRCKTQDSVRPSPGHAVADRALFARYREDGDSRARDELVARFMPLARKLAARYQRAEEPFEDLVQVAALGLIKAVDRYDPSRGTAFSSFAVPTITGELRRYFRDHTWSIHVPRELQERTLEVQRARERLWTELGRSPTVAEVAHAIGVQEETVLEALEVASAYRAGSLDQPRRGDEGDEETVGAAIGDDDAGYLLAEQRARLAPLTRILTDREREVLHLRFSEDLTQAEIGERIGVSQMQVSRIIRLSLKRLREYAAARAGRPAEEV